jgi:ATP-dependent Lon protease
MLHAGEVAIVAEESSLLVNIPPSGVPNPPDDALGAEAVLPVLPLHDTVVFPNMLAPLIIFDEQAIHAVELAYATDRLVLAVTRRDQVDAEQALDGLYPIGVEAIVQRIRKLPDGSTSVVLEGQRRMRLTEAIPQERLLRARAASLYIENDRTIAVEAMMRAVLAIYEKVVRLSRLLPDDAYTTALNMEDPGGLADLIASTLPLSTLHRQQILETIDPEERLHRVGALLSQELDLLELESRIQNQVQKEVDRSQREFFLREQMKAIQRELGQDDPQQRDVLALRERLAQADLSERARARADEELSRLEMLAPLSPEYSVVRTYVDWLINLPWQHTVDEATDLRAAARLLEQNHYGLKKVKERILEFIAVRQLAAGNLKAPILCFIGPPGVGKTSLGQSIATALGRPFLRLSLGGVHDEAEIRGHRRTYIGAMPGRIVQRMKEAGCINPVFMLDEIDKLGSDFRGDPAAALLEALDPEQNHTFADHYLEVPFDLSKVFFITTANYGDDIPAALADRMEMIELTGYTEAEKLNIARRFLVPRQYAANGLPPSTLNFSDTAIQLLIQRYTYEAGVRNLEREIAAVCRKTARRMVEGRTHPRRITPHIVERYIGPPRFDGPDVVQPAQIGVATGMVYTGVGGDTMPVEVVLMEGKGTMTLTGQLGEVMQESAQAALSYIRANAAALKINPRRFEKVDIHLHVPEGATPKEGPSAGVTITVALVSAFTERLARRDIALTGEITLTGRVLPIGGVREKILGAYRAGIRTVILPAKNRHELVDIPAAVRTKLTIHWVETVAAALDLVLGPPPAKPAPRRTVAKKAEE